MIKMKMAVIISLIVCLMFSACKEKLSINYDDPVNIIPLPSQITLTGGLFELNDRTVIQADKDLAKAAEQLRNYLSPATGFLLPSKYRLSGKNIIELKISEGSSELGDEGYKIKVTEKKIQIAAYDARGIFWGIQTLRQLLPVEILRDALVDNVRWKVPCIEIVDQPRFGYRGLMIDYSRTHWNLAHTKKYIDALAYYKMNVLHMHLTDNQGWRLEIDKYPDLTGKGSHFDPVFNEPPEREGYYTKDDIRELIAYAGDRNIELIPEIEMPAHAGAVFAAYPEYSCLGDTLKIYVQQMRPRIRTEIFCPGKEKTFEFLENILAEVIDLFPSEYVHIGGDEAPKHIWEKCPDCQKRIADQGLEDEIDLQSWFTRRIEDFIISNNKILVGWDEIALGGLTSTAIVMYWDPVREDAVLAAHEQGNKIIMTPLSHLYFDYSYERIPTEKVYSFEPFSGKFYNANPEQILGVQANFWSHLARTEASMDRQIFPRFQALAEVGWSKKENRDWDSFQVRLRQHFMDLYLMDIYYTESI